MASLERCSVEPNCLGPTGVSLCEANWAGSQENARRNTCPGSTITQLLSPLCTSSPRSIHLNVARQPVADTGELSGRFEGAVRMSGQVVAQGLSSSVNAASHRA